MKEEKPGDASMKMESVLDEGTDVDLQDEEGWPALMAASHAGQTRVVELLLPYANLDIATQVNS